MLDGRKRPLSPGDLARVRAYNPTRSVVAWADASFSSVRSESFPCNTNGFVVAVYYNDYVSHRATWQCVAMLVGDRVMFFVAADLERIEA